ncbi:MATE family efflux transporter [Psychrilyobacter sp.]|uniref:MATE family efflux transporter n=1 Tax=Psychrilyobacter sp. TaxID=2586924 RepID=UPI00301B0F7E
MKVYTKYETNLFNTLFNIVDTLYASYIGSNAVSGLTLSFPIFFILVSIGSGMGTDTTALISNLLGEKNIGNARDISEDSISLGITLSFFFTFLGIFLTGTIFRFLNAPTETTVYGVQYIHIIIGGSLFFILNSSFNAILSAQGDTKPYRNFLILGFFLNLILNPLFILVFNMGIADLALSTVFIQIIGSFYLLKKVIRSPLFS